MNQLPLAGRVYVASVILAGAIVMAIGLPLADFTAQPVLFASLVIVGSAAAAMKVTLPLTSGGSTMSVSYAVDFAALLLLGPHDAMIVAIASTFCQCHVSNKEKKNPAYRTLFSVAAVVLTIQGAGLAIGWTTDPSAAVSVSTFAGPLLAAATAYFILNTGLIAGAVALSTGESVSTTWRTNFLWSAPSYFVGAGAAAIVA